MRHIFAEIFHEAELCRFPDCRHAGEPGCAVALAVAEERICPARYQSYLTLMGEAEGREA